MRWLVYALRRIALRLAMGSHAYSAMAAVMGQELLFEGATRIDVGISKRGATHRSVEAQWLNAFVQLLAPPPIDKRDPVKERAKFHRSMRAANRLRERGDMEGLRNMLAGRP